MSGRRAKILRQVKKGSENSPKKWKVGLAAGLVTTALAPMPSWALWENLANVSGSATITNLTPTSQQVNVFTGQYVGTLGSANIAANEAVRVQQPSAASMALFRIAGQEATAIYGSLSANGQIFLVNPSGILFSSSARVDVGALTASTLNISTEDFLSGTYRFSQMPGSANAAVVNHGVITAGPGGYVALLGAAVRNEGIILANLGSIALTAGKAATLDMRGDGLIAFVVTDAISGAVTGPDGQSLTSYVSNTGTLQADGGLVTLTANAATDVIKSVVNQEGIIRAQSIEERNGTIVLSGGSDGIVTVSGTIDASGTGAGQTGGTVQVFGDKVDIRQASIRSQSASLTAHSALAVYESGIHTQGNLSLFAGNKVTIRDSAARPLTLIAGGDLTIQGNQNIDILALKHLTETPFQSGGNMRLISDGNVSGDSHFFSGGRFDILTTKGQPGTFVSYYDPIISATGNVTFGAYTGVALLVQSTGSITSTGAITITGADLTVAAVDADTTLLNTSAALILRANLGALVPYAGALSVPPDQTAGGATFASGGAGAGINLNGGTITTAGGPVILGGAVTLGANTTINAGAGAVTFTSTVNGARTLTVNSTGTTTFGGAVGAGTALTNLITNAGGTTVINGGSIRTNGSQTYNDAVTLGANTVLTAGEGGITFANTLNGAFSLTANAGGFTTFGGVVGGATALTSLTTNASGTTRINGGSITTSGAQTYNDHVTLGANTILTSTGAGNITFAATLRNAVARTLTVNTSGTTTFGGAVGGGTALASLTTNAGGTTAINGGSIRTSGGQTYNDAVTLGANTTLTSTGAGAVTFANTVNGARTLTVNTTGATTFTGAVGGGTALTSLTTNAGGTTALNGGAVTTTGSQTYNDALTFGANTTLTSTGAGTIRFGNTANGAFNLTTNSGTFTNNSTLNTSAGPGNITVNASAVTLGNLNAGTGTITVNTGGVALNIGSLDAGTLTASALNVTSGSMTTGSSLTFGGALNLVSSGNITVTNPVTATGALSATAAGAITGAGGIGGTTSTTLTAASVGVIPNQTGIGTTPLRLTGAGPLTITVSGATATNGISVQSAGSILLGSVTANGGGGRVIVLDSINGQLNGTGAAAPQVVGGKVILLAHTLADIGFPGSLGVNSSAPPVLCGASAGGAAGAGSCAFPANVNNSFAAFAANLNLQTSNLQSGILTGLTPQLVGPQLLSSGILPEATFLTAECHEEDKKRREEDKNGYKDIDENRVVVCVKTLVAQGGGNRGASGVVIVAP